MTTLNLRLVPPLNLTNESATYPELKPTTPNPSLISFNKNPNLSEGMCLLSIVKRRGNYLERSPLLHFPDGSVG